MDGRIGKTPDTARHADPAFVPSLYLLIVREKYSLADIGMMFGVSRERVRQWVNQYGIQHRDELGIRGLHHIRVWDDASNCFRPDRKGKVLKAKNAKKVQERREAKEKAQAERRRRMINVIVRLKEELGRDPTTLEMADAVAGRPIPARAAGAVLATMWSPSLAGSGSKPAYQELRRALAAHGILPRKRGQPGHIHPRKERRDATQ